MPGLGKGRWSGRRTDAAVDVGLQAERTMMAWQRTGLGVAGVSALLLHQGHDRVWVAVPAVLGLLGALLVLAGSERRYRRTVDRIEAGQDVASPQWVAGLAAGMVLLALGAALVTVVG